MIKNKKITVIIILAAVILGAVLLVATRKKAPGEVIRETKPFIGDIRSSITSTAVVPPQNRLEVKPPINGRIDKILVKEGDSVKAGQTLAMMSSTERAALLDAARGYGPEQIKYWEDVYKPAPLIAPIDGEVIVSTDQPGQTVTSSDVVMVLSDNLIVQAQVDETDIGKVSVGQGAVISLDAYPEIKVKGKVVHIYYESTIVNNVTIYKVDIRPETVPPVFRSGMSATVNIIEKEKDGILLIPVEAVRHEKDGTYVLIKNGAGKAAQQKVELGITDEKNAEVLSGVSEGDIILIASQKFKLPEAAKGSNPLMPSPRRRR